MEFSEANGPWLPLPQWVAFMIRCGFICGDSALGIRRISVVSMPGDSAAAGLLALGAMRRRLSVKDADDSGSHFQRLERLATQSGSMSFLRHQTHRGRFVLYGRDRDGFLWARQEYAASDHGPVRIAIFPTNANDWRIDGEAPIHAVDGSELPYRAYYQALVQTPTLIAPNLTRSDSAICLAGRVAGESASQMMLSAIRFQRDNQVVDLPKLLTVHRWSVGTVSRVTFFNTRTHQLDRGTGLTQLVIADGDAAFLKVVDADEFRLSDVIGVVHRAIERDRLESVGHKLGDLTQWYASDTERLDGMPPLPVGIAISMMRRR